MMGIFFLSKEILVAASVFLVLFAIGFLGRLYIASTLPKSSPKYAFDRCDFISQMDSVPEESRAHEVKWEKIQLAYTLPCLRPNAFRDLNAVDEEDDTW